MIWKVLITGMVLLMLAVMVFTWGSMGSTMMAYGLIIMGCALLYQRFLTNWEESDYQMED